MARAQKNCAGRQIDMCSRKPKIERLVNARLPITGIRQITERDSGSERVIGWIDIQLVPDHLAISKRARVIRTNEHDFATAYRRHCPKNDCEQERHSHLRKLRRAIFSARYAEKYPA